MEKFSLGGAISLLLLSSCVAETGYVYRGDKVLWTEYSGSSVFPSLKRYERVVPTQAEHFQVTAYNSWGHDTRHAFYRGQITGTIDASTFMALSDYIAKDDVTVWHRDEAIVDAHAPSFRLLDGKWAIDQDSGYYASTRFEVCDISTFSVLETGLDAFAVDDICAYSRSFRIPVAARDSFQLLGAGYSMDHKQVYWNQFVVKGADPSSFYVPDGMRVGRDKTNCWRGAQSYDCVD